MESCYDKCSPVYLCINDFDGINNCSKLKKHYNKVVYMCILAHSLLCKGNYTLGSPYQWTFNRFAKWKFMIGEESIT